MLNVINKFVTRGTKRHYDDETNRRIVVVNLFSAVGTSITFVLGIRALFSQNYSLAIILFIASIFFLLSQAVQINFETVKGRFISVTLLITCLMMLMATLLITGGNASTGPLWIYTVPPVTMFFAGFRRGIFTLSGFTAIIIALLFSPNDALLLTTYTYEFKTRLVYSFLTVSFLSAFYEYSRQRSYDTAVFLSEKFEKQALHDSLTQLLNRRGGQQQLEQEYSRLQRSKKPFAIALADIDRFKSINDSLGHEVGDEVLKRVAGKLKSRLRGQDALSRWGGEEFLFIYPETDEANAMSAAEHVRKLLDESPVVINGEPRSVTISIGVTELTPSTSLSDALIKADKALYKAKDSGRNQVIAASSL